MFSISEEILEVRICVIAQIVQQEVRFVTWDGQVYGRTGERRSNQWRQRKMIDARNRS